MKLVGPVTLTEEKIDVYRILAVKPKGNRQLGIPRRRWEDKIKKDSHGKGCGPCTDIYMYIRGRGMPKKMYIHNT